MIGESIGPYRVDSLLGRGGMGEVYRARDTRLERDVALKILPAELAGDRDRLGRFEREARVLASLQHQNIASIYGLERFGEQPVLVMELAEGEDLSERLRAGPLDPDEVDGIARQLARGLEYAHEQGIVHRDLKPANIKLGKDGRVKILDFGLARAFTGVIDGSGTSAPAMTAATMPQELTRPGTVLGTAAYMSPEQARGYDVDRRTDIWAFGVILFEMLCGHKLFAGETASDTLAAILRQEPDWEDLPAATSPVLTTIVRRCLEKDPRKRLRDIGEVRIALEDGSSAVMSLGSSASGVALNPDLAAPRRPVLPWVLVVLLALLLGGMTVLGMSGRLGPGAAPPALVRAQVMLPEKTAFYLNPANPGPPVVSPDGRHIAFSGTDSTGRTMLFVRTLAEAEARSIAGTQNAAYPFWAPNSRELGFFNSDDLCRVDILGGPVVPVCRADNGKGGSWSADDVILFAPTHVASICRVPASGGEVTEVTSVRADTTSRSHRFPCWLPDGRHFVYLAWRNPAAARETGNETVVRLASIDDSLDRDLMISQTNAIYAGGSLLHVHEHNLMSRPFSLETLDFAGPPRPLLGGVLSLQAAHVAVMSASEAGVLAYVAGGGVFGQSQMWWLDEDGGEDGVLPETVTSPQGIDISPDGSRVAVARADDRVGTFDIWIYELGRDVGARFTFESESEQAPIWSADGRRLCYAATTATGTAIFEKIATGAGRPTKIVDLPGNSYPSCWSHDDRRLAFTLVGDDGDWDLWVFDRDRADSLQTLRETPFDEGMPSFSPDDAWLAYNSNETGSPEVFVESLAGDGARYRISSNGGMHAQWSADGTRLYYLDTVGNLLETRIEAAGGALAIGETRTVASGIEVSLRRTHAIDRTTGRLLAQRPMQDRVSNRLQLITGWQTLLARE